MLFSRHLLAALLTVQVATAAENEWSLSAPLENRRDSYLCPRGTGAGPFALSASIVLDKLDGTAASVWFGTALNLGFDGGKNHALFIEGPAVGGKSRPLDTGAGILKPGAPFAFEATRDADGLTRFRIDGQEVYQTMALKGRPLGFTFRPHRNTMGLRSLALAGDLAPPPPPLESRVPVAPLFIGEANPSLPAQRLAFPIHKHGDHGCDTFRIPGLARTNAGTLLAVYDMRYNSARDLQEDIDIGLSRSTDGGQTWEKPRPIMDMGEYGGKPQKENGCSDPNILVDRNTGEIFVSALWTHGKPNTHQWQGTGSEPGFEIGKTAQFMVVRSTDDGVTWSPPENWTRKLKQEDWWLFAPAPGNGITMEDGTLVMPTQGRDAKGHPFSNLMWSRDHGKTWTLGAAARHDTTECSVVELSDHSLMLNIRDNRNRADKGDTNGRAVSVTSDLGQTWTVHPSDHALLPEPTCMASLINHTMPDGRHVLFFSNPNDKNARRNITVQASLDDGKTWPDSQHVLLDEGTGYGYSSLAVIDDETLGILYESSRADMTFQKIRISELIGE